LSILYYSNKLSRAFENFISTTRLLIFTATSYRKIQEKQEKHNRLIVFSTIFSILINSTILRFRKKNLKSLIINKKQQM